MLTEFLFLNVLCLINLSEFSVKSPPSAMFYYLTVWLANVDPSPIYEFEPFSIYKNGFSFLLFSVLLLLLVTTYYWVNQFCVAILNDPNPLLRLLRLFYIKELPNKYGFILLLPIPPRNTHKIF